MIALRDPRSFHVCASEPNLPMSLHAAGLATEVLATAGAAAALKVSTYEGPPAPKFAAGVGGKRARDTEKSRTFTSTKRHLRMPAVVPSFAASTPASSYRSLLIFLLFFLSSSPCVLPSHLSASSPGEHPNSPQPGSPQRSSASRTRPQTATLRRPAPPLPLGTSTISALAARASATGGELLFATTMTCLMPMMCNMHAHQRLGVSLFYLSRSREGASLSLLLVLVVLLSRGISRGGRTVRNCFQVLHGRRAELVASPSRPWACQRARLAFRSIDALNSLGVHGGEKMHDGEAAC